MGNFRALILYGLLFFLLAGCARVMDLKGLSENRAETQKYIQAQEEGFIKLKSDVLAGRLQKGISKDEVTSRYAPPIYCEAASTDSNAREVCLYRLPLQYFNTDLVYLFFDEGEQLAYWQLKEPASGEVDR